MNPSRRWTKGLVIISSCALVGGYLLYAGSNAMKSSSKRGHFDMSERQAPAPVDTPAESTVDARTMMSSSKFAAVSIPATQPAVAPLDREMIRSGYKSAPMVTPEMVQGALTPATAPATQPTTAPAPPARTMMPGSKSFQVTPPK